MNAIPDNLPVIENARLPQTYEAAKVAIAECSRIDECKNWADQAEALASYARQAKDDYLRKMADRIQARAIRRCGELLKVYSAQGKRTDLKLSSVNPTKSQREAAQDAGLSKDQQVTAVRVANIPEDDFKEAVESDNPPTVTALAEQGKKTRPIVDIGNKDPEEFSISTQGQGILREFAEFCKSTDAGSVARGAMPGEMTRIRMNVAIVDSWLDQLITQLGN